MKPKKEFINTNKKKYSVYYVGKGTGCYAENYKKIYLGDTWAISPEKACSNVRYRMRDKSNPNGGYSINYLDDSQGLGYVFYQYEAIEV